MENEYKKDSLNFEKPTLENGGQSQEAIVGTSPDKQPVNAPTVEDIKRIAKGEAEAASATEWEKSIKDHLYEEDSYVVACSTYGLVIVVTDINKGVTIGTDTDNDTLTFDFSYLQLGYSDRSGMYIDVEEQEIGCTSVRCEYITDSETEGVVCAENLLNGKRVYKHDITIEGRLEGETTGSKFLYITVYNSSQNEIDSLAELEDIASGAVGMFEAASNEIAYISGVSLTYNTISILGSTSGSIGMDTILDIADDITQC